ncbi:MAG: hypothetical protein ACTHU0_12430 [Kofleriaceae bacterium]
MKYSIESAPTVSGRRLPRSTSWIRSNIAASPVDDRITRLLAGADRRQL